MAANVAAQMALAGKRVAVIDTDIQSPGIHVLFGFSGPKIENSLNDFLAGTQNIDDAAHDVTESLGAGVDGRIFLIPCSAQTDRIVSVLREGYNVSQLTQGFRHLISSLSLDALLIDTHPGLNEETLFSLAISHGLLIVMRPDQQDYEGTAVTVEVARSLEVPKTTLVVNNTPVSFDVEMVRQRVKDAYAVDSVFVLPHCEEMMTLASGGIFSTVYPEHPLTDLYKRLAGIQFMF